MVLTTAELLLRHLEQGCRLVDPQQILDLLDQAEEDPATDRHRLAECRRSVQVWMIVQHTKDPRRPRPVLPPVRRAFSGVASLLRSQAQLEQMTATATATSSELARQQETTVKAVAKAQELNTALTWSQRLAQKLGQWWR
jgi:hypothetical protein